MPRPGNSAATCGATHPRSGAGSHSAPGPIASTPSISATARSLDPPGGTEKSVDPGAELGGGEVADAGALQGPTGKGVGERRAAPDAVERRYGAVAVEADRHPP